MIEIEYRLLGFLPQMATFVIAVGLIISLLIIQRVNDWVNEKVKLPWMEETNLQQRKRMEQRKGSE
ncbi:hypothetical protein DS745_13545 [Anaerobacillus alkaliphilus]|uniref:Uncharacterized protein n=1 Tax=Anaerobacillus alkaliphilus TaxID=1548597 RepID=A0A4Q0VSC0_9BACI|nr:hypothetical protein [Anaerobacillus alkaliphilus]RXI99898.1 hypothetical protein DS745_13545 [Anaerobacillus alkaliphilus]